MNVLKLPKQRLEEIILEEIQKFKLLTEEGIQLNDDQIKSMIEQVHTNKEALSSEQLQVLAPILHQVLSPAPPEGTP